MNDTPADDEFTDRIDSPPVKPLSDEGLEQLRWLLFAKPRGTIGLRPVVCLLMRHDVVESERDDARARLEHAERRLTHALWYVPIEDLELDRRALNVLTNAGILRVADLIQKTPEDILALRNSGTKTLANIQDRLRDAYGLTLKPDTAEADNAA